MLHDATTLPENGVVVRKTTKSPHPFTFLSILALQRNWDKEKLPTVNIPPTVLHMR